ncbi:MAG: DNA polymerase III subunit epsilon [Rhodospirillales bacterium]|nr:DNA polymerase III subunit epsilon [Rhodospirillales bacterium]
MREIVLDTETTGIDPAAGHRVVEIGCVELVNHIPTGQVYHAYVNPERPMPTGAFAVHGLSDAFLAEKPLFVAVADGLMDFIGGDPLIIHNAAFDVGFLNAELARCGRRPIAAERAVCTLTKARQMFPGAPASLDALCRRYEIDISDRSVHGALKDSQLLAAVYLELIGGRQPRLTLASVLPVRRTGPVASAARRPLLIQPTPGEAAAHAAFIARLPEALWSLARSSRVGEARRLEEA